MPTDGQKTTTEYRGFTITEKYFRQDPYRVPDTNKKKRTRMPDVGWSFGVYGVIGRQIFYYTSWSRAIFFGDHARNAYMYATDLVDEIHDGKLPVEVSIVTLPEIQKT